MRCCSRYELGFKLWWRLHHHLVGGSGCNVVAILSANKTDKSTLCHVCVSRGGHV